MDMKKIREMEDGRVKEFSQFHDSSLLCVTLRFRGHYNGYVGVPKTHKYFKKQAHEAEIMALKVHGGVSYAGFNSNVPEFDSSLWWFGFDTTHAGDENGKEDDLPFVRAETVKLAEQLAKVE